MAKLVRSTSKKRSVPMMMEVAVNCRQVAGSCVLNCFTSWYDDIS